VEISKKADKMVRGVNGTIFDKLTQLGLFRLEEQGSFNSNESVHLKSGGFMDLVIEKLGKDHYSFTHYFEQNGDLCPDPDMEIHVFPEMKMAEALTIQDQFGYRCVYPEPNKVNLMAKKHLNDFLNTWLRNLLQQGFKV
jgi:hypothetical protein